MTSLLAVIPYTTFPEINIGPLTIRTFGTLVGIGVLIGAWVAARYLERFDVDREETYRLATRLVVAGIIGSRVTWVITHWDQIESPIDTIAVWDGGLQFSGGFIAAILVGLPTFRKWSPGLRWRSLDGYAYGLTIGLAIGRIGCYSVGEHFGGQSDFFLANRYEGGSVQERFIGDVPLVEGMTFHNTSLYEMIHLAVLFAVMALVVRRSRRSGSEPPAGTLVGLFVVWYGVARFVTDFTRVNDNTVLGLTGAQYMTAVMVPIGLWIMFRVRHLVPAEVEGTGTSADDTDTSDADTVMDDLDSDPITDDSDTAVADLDVDTADADELDSDELDSDSDGDEVDDAAADGADDAPAGGGVGGDASDD